MDAKAEAAEHDARALLALSKSLVDNVRAMKPLPPERLLESVETAHAEVLRASHLVTCWTVSLRHSERNGR